MGCETACREANGYGYGEQWMQVLRGKPYYVDGKLRMNHLVAPSLDKCGGCAADGSEPLCSKCCPTNALKFGLASEVLELAATKKAIVFLP